MSETFTDRSKRQYSRAKTSNQQQAQQEVPEYYYCATSTGTTERSLDLDSEYVFCTDENAERSRQENLRNGRTRRAMTSLENKLQAYIIKKALQNNYKLPINDNWVLLDAERNFASEDLLRQPREGRKLDILAYDTENHCFIVLELKQKYGSGVYDTAKNQLLRYTNIMITHIADARRFYDEAEATGVRGYIVWPAGYTPYKPDPAWKIIEYQKDLLEGLTNQGDLPLTMR